jgi:hypothetical protein
MIGEMLFTIKSISDFLSFPREGLSMDPLTFSNMLEISRFIFRYSSKVLWGITGEGK